MKTTGSETDRKATAIGPGTSERSIRVFFCLLLLLSLFFSFVGCGKEFPPTPGEGEVAVHFIDVGQGDAILIRDGTKTVLIDTGNSQTEHTDALISYLRKRDVSVIDYLILTHPDEDHIGGAARILECFSVSVCLLPDAVNDTPVFRNTLDALDAASVYAAEAKAGDVYPLSAATFVILSPFGRETSQNGRSVVLRLTVGTRHFLFTGDAGDATERTLLATYPESRLRADVLKVSHHGATGAGSDAFLDAVSPTYGVISCGKNNIYGHPAGETVFRYGEHGIRLYRTDVSGSIVFLTDGTNLSVDTER